MLSSNVKCFTFTWNRCLQVWFVLQWYFRELYSANFDNGEIKDIWKPKCDKS